MSEQPEPTKNLADELQNLGMNLARAMRAAWDSPDSKRLRDEFLGGMNDLGSTIRNEASAFADSSTAQRLKSDVQQIGERVRSSETQARVRQELLTVLQTANTELEKVINRWAAEANPVTEASESDAASAAEEPPAASETTDQVEQG